MKTTAYTIRHIDLHDANVQTSWPAGNYYFVFWFASIPLGDKYLHTNGLNASSFAAVVTDAITRCLGSYERPSPLPESQITFENIRERCASALSQFLPSRFPDTCDVSVVICTRNRPAQLRECLHRLGNQVSKPAEIIVVDNASNTDETREVIEAFRGVRYVRENRPGLDIARNTGARLANSHIVAYTDDDTIPNSFWVYRVFESFRSPHVAAMTGLVLAASLQTEAEVIFEKFWPFNRGYIAKIYDDKFFLSALPDGPPVWEIGAGANMAFRKELFDQVGYFDERLDVGAAGCSGDSEQWYRILASGFQILYNPLAVVQHCHRSSMHDLRSQLHHYMRGFTVAVLIQYQRFRHIGNLRQLAKVFPFYYLKLMTRGFPFYKAQYQTVFSEFSGIVSGLFFFWRNRHNGQQNFHG